MATYSVTLTPQFQSDYAMGEDLGFRLIITASDPSDDLVTLNGGDLNVFRYIQKPARPDGVVEGVFSGVCSWPDYVEMPVGVPENDTLPANFRLNYIDLVVESESIAFEVWSLIQTQVAQLMQTIEDGQILTTGTPFVASSQ
jgi:hypothetical protein